MRTLLSVLLLTLLLCLPALAQEQDTDGDGLSDAIEKALGTDPNFAEVLTPIGTDKTREQGDRVGTDNYSPGVDLTGVALGNVARDRYLWRLDFAGPIATDQCGVIIYLDADGDRKTGRSDMGCEYMLTFLQGSAGIRAFAADGKESPQAMRAAVVGNHLYLCADLAIKQEGGQAVGDYNVLIETRNPYKMVDTLDRTHFAVAGESAREKIIGAGDLLTSRDMLVTWPRFPELERIKANPANVLLHAWECDLKGFELNIQTEYVNRHVLARGGAPHVLTAKAPRSGRFTFGFFTYQGSGRENWVVRVRGKEIGVAVASESNRRQCLFFTPQPLDLKAGDELQLELAYGGAGLLEDLILMPQPPPLVKLPRTLTNLEARPVLGADGRLRGEVTFLTTWPVQAEVTIKGAGQTRTLKDAEPVANHRLWLDEIAPDAVYDVTVKVVSPEQQPLSAATKLTAKLPTPLIKVERATLPLTCTNPQEQELKGWPVTQGLPFPPQAIGSPDNLRLLNAAGREVPLQVTPLAWWGDGAVKWALLDFQADLPAKQTTAFTLEYGSRVKRAPVGKGLRVADTADTLTVDTGVLKVELPRQAGSFLGRIWLDRSGDGQYTADELLSGDQAGAVQLGFGGKTLSNAAAPRVSVLRPGPLHTIIRVDGGESEGGASFGDQQELHFFAGKPYCLVYDTFTNTNTTQTFSMVQSLDLSRPLALGDNLQARFGTGAQGMLSGNAALTQGFDDQYTVTGLGAPQTGKRAANWADLAGSRGGVTVAVRHLWQLYPKRLALSPEGLQIGLMPAFAPGTYKVSKEGELEDKLYFYLKDDAYKLKAGVSKRHEMLFAFRGPGGEPAAAECAAFDTPPILKASPEWYCGSGAFLEVLPASANLGGVFASYEDGVNLGVTDYLKSRESGREYGMLNYGDWWGERGRNWGNIEYDTQYAAFLQFVRSGDERCYWIGQDAARHNHDVDMIWAGDPHQVGKVYAHCIGHTGNYYDHKVNDQGTAGGGCSVSHTWVEGYLADYFLSGDQRGLESATLCADVYDGAYLNNYDYDNGRTSGWHLILTMGQYRATNDPFYRNAARVILDRVAERAVPQGGWIREMMPGHCYCLPRHRGAAGFMIGVLMSGLRDMEFGVAGAEIDPLIVGGSRQLIREMWVPERKAMRYTSCPNSTAGGLETMTNEGLLRAYQATGDKTIGEIARLSVLANTGRVSAMGKGFTMGIRRMPEILYSYRQLMLDPYDFAPGQEVRVLLKQPVAADFEVVLRPRSLGQIGGTAVLRKDGKPVAEAALDQRPAVTLKVPAAAGAGLYELLLRPTGEAPWDLECRLDQQIVDVSKPVALGRSSWGSYCLNLPATGKTVITLGAVERGRYAAELRNADGKVLKATWANNAQIVADAAQGFKGRCLLTVSERPKRASYTVQIAGALPYLSFWPGQLFAPGEPIPVIGAQSNFAPGGSARVSFDATGTTDADNDVVGYRWDFGDGTQGEGARVQHEYRQPGSYRVTLTVRDKLGCEGTARTGLVVPPLWVMQLDPKRAVTVEAEDFSGQGGGEVLVTTRSGHSGKMLTRWEADKGHWLEWKLPVAQAGEYRLVLRYASGSDQALRSVLVDGAAPAGWEPLALPGTGGFGDPASTWQYYQSPGKLTLTPGEHVLRLTNTGGGLALDQVLLAPAE